MPRCCHDDEVNLPGPDNLIAALHVVSLPLNTRFRGVDHREVALFDGPSGWGEFGPFLEYAPEESSRWLAAAIETGWHGFPEAVRDSVPVNATVPAVADHEVEYVLARYDGCRTAKVKVAERGQSLTDDLARVAATRVVMGPDARIRVDANGGWTVDDALDAIAQLAPYGLEYVEQPCTRVEDLAALRVALARNGIDVLVAADESIRKAEDPFRVKELDAADVAVVKVAPLGGVRNALRVAEQIELPVVVSSALESSVGMSAGVAFAAALPDLPFACGLGTIELFDADVVTDSVVPHDGSLSVRTVTPEPELLDRWAASPDRIQWWKRRVQDAYMHLPR
ncbi:O-succinylbenzoate synthase [Yimella sp. RIT 621]|nr:O-succinylbenzoate synthase [Yimella sp. RIT 621]